MVEQVKFVEWFDENCKGLNGEARRLMQMSWNAALTNGDRHFFVDELSDAVGYRGSDGTTWSDLIKYVEGNCPKLPPEGGIADGDR